jgi:hypothetical protein
MAVFITVLVISQLGWILMAMQLIQLLGAMQFVQ